MRDKNIKYCIGCGNCYNLKKACSQKDDMDEVLKKMIAADAIVMATPVYFYTMNGQMKTLIDRTCSRYTEIKNMDIYFIVAAADNSRLWKEHLKDSGDLLPVLKIQKKRVLFMEQVPRI